jgi:hypothetical protein
MDVFVEIVASHVWLLLRTRFSGSSGFEHGFVYHAVATQLRLCADRSAAAGRCHGAVVSSLTADRAVLLYYGPGRNNNTFGLCDGPGFGPRW